ncbi:hypothetical protein D3C81_989450 [compost metagenome]
MRRRATQGAAHVTGSAARHPATVPAPVHDPGASDADALHRSRLCASHARPSAGRASPRHCSSVASVASHPANAVGFPTDGSSRPRHCRRAKVNRPAPCWGGGCASPPLEHPQQPGRSPGGCVNGSARPLRHARQRPAPGRAAHSLARLHRSAAARGARSLSAAAHPRRQSVRSSARRPHRSTPMRPPLPGFQQRTTGGSAHPPDHRAASRHSLHRPRP